MSSVAFKIMRQFSYNSQGIYCFLTRKLFTLKQFFHDTVHKSHREPHNEVGLVGLAELPVVTSQ